MIYDIQQNFSSLSNEYFPVLHRLLIRTKKSMNSIHNNNNNLYLQDNERDKH